MKNLHLRFYNHWTYLRRGTTEEFHIWAFALTLITPPVFVEFELGLAGFGVIVWYSAE